MFIFFKKIHFEKFSKNINKIREKYTLKLFQNSTLYILYNDAELISLSDNKIIIYEKLFSKTDFEEVTVDNLKSISSLNSFIDLFYGSYIWIEYINDGFKIYRDISGKSRIFYNYQNNVDIYFSDVFLWYNLIDKDPKFNLEYLQKFVLEGNFLSTHTAHVGINEIPPGWQLCYKLDKPLLNSYWLTRFFNICHFKTTKNLEEKLLTTLIGVISNQIKNVNNIVVDFSGGVDSTGIMLLVNFVKHKYQTVVAGHYYSENVKSSCELEYVQEVINNINIPLMTVKYSENDLPFTPRATALKQLNYVHTTLVYGRNDEVINSYIKPTTNKVFISGHGGDHIFCCPPLVCSLIDRLFHFNLFKTPKYFKDFAIYHGIPLLKIFSFILKFMFTSTNKVLSNSNLFIKNNSELCFPLDFNLEVLPGKKEHVQLLHDALADIRYNIRGESPILYPLLQEPIIEIVLQLKTYDLFQNEMDRFPYRKIIKNKFGCYKSLDRQSKGETSGIIFAGLIKNKKTVQEYLFNGNLAQCGVIDIDRLRILFQNALNGVLQENELNEIMNLWNSEEFYRSW